MRCPRIKKAQQSDYEEDIPEEVRRIQEEYLDEGDTGEVDWEEWYFIAIHIFNLSDREFFEETTLRRLDVLMEKYKKFNEKN